MSIDITSGPLNEVRTRLDTLIETPVSDIRSAYQEVCQAIADAESTIDEAVENITVEVELARIDSDLRSEFISRSMEEANNRVHNGIALLDEYFPGWWDSIELGTLDMASATSCICGQLFGPKAAGLFSRADAEFRQIQEQVATGTEVNGERVRQLDAIRFDFRDFANGSSGYSVGTSTRLLRQVAPNVPEEVARTLADDPAMFGFTNSHSEDDDALWQVTYRQLGVLWENEIRLRHRMYNLFTSSVEEITRQLISTPV